jgi:hypothetical protein
MTEVFDNTVVVFVDKLPEALKSRGRPRSKEIETVAKLLQERPGIWALVKTDVKPHKRESWKKSLGPNFELSVRKQPNSVDPKNVDLYARYVGE